MINKKTILVVMVGIFSLLLVNAGLSVAFTTQGEGNNLAEDDDNGDDDGYIDDPSDDDEDDDDDDVDDDNDDEEDDYDDDDEISIGHFENGTDGKFVSFDLVQNIINNYTIKRGNDSITAFNKITIENFVIDDQENEGVYYEIEGDDTDIKIFDVAPGLMKINSEGEDLTNISFDLGDFQVNGQNGRNLNLTYGNYSAKILSVSQGPPDKIPVEYGDDKDDEDKGREPPVNVTPPINITPPDIPENYLKVTVENGYINYSFTGDTFILFRMTDLKDERESELEEEISEGISRNEIGGEISIDSDNVGYREVSIEYADMRMMTQVQEKNKVKLMVSSNTLRENGKIVVAEISKRVLNVDDVKDMEIRFDDEKISMADDYADLKDISDGAEYLISIGQDKIQVLVMVPNFSTHSIDITKDITKAVESGTNIIGNISYYIPAVVITSLIIVSTVWVSKKR
ncbi:MAG: hypothetical protein ACOC7O_00820 [Thermoplasmatota archaeon]